MPQNSPSKNTATGLYALGSLAGLLFYIVIFSQQLIKLENQKDQEKQTDPEKQKQQENQEKQQNQKNEEVQKQQANLLKLNQQEKQKQEEIELETLLGFNTVVRDVLVIRTVSARALNYHVEQYGEPQSFEMHESIFAFIALFYLASAALNAYISQKDLPPAIKNKMIYDIIDSVTWSAIAIMRLPGTLPSLMFDIEWYEISTTVFDGCVLGMYVIELINTLYFDCKEYMRITDELKKLNKDDPKYNELIYKQNKALLNIGVDTVHLSSMVIGISLKIAATATPAGLLLMVIATLGNQLKNLIYAVTDLYKATYQQNDPTVLINAQRKFAIETTKLGVMFTVIGLLALGNPIGASIFVLGLAGYLLMKTVDFGFGKYLEHKEKNTPLTPQYNSSGKGTIVQTTGSSLTPSSHAIPNSPST